MSADRGHNVVKHQFSQLDPQIQMQYPIKISVSYFVAISKQTISRERRARRVTAILKEKDEVGGLTSPKFKTFIKLSFIKLTFINYVFGLKKKNNTNTSTDLNKSQKYIHRIS